MASGKCNKCRHDYSSHDFSYSTKKNVGGVVCTECPSGICK